MSNQVEKPTVRSITPPTLGQKLKHTLGRSNPEDTGHKPEDMRYTRRQKIGVAVLSVLAGLGALKGLDYRMDVVEAERREQDRLETIQDMSGPVTPRDEEERQQLIDQGWRSPDPLIETVEAEDLDRLMPPKYGGYRPSETDVPSTSAPTQGEN